MSKLPRDHNHRGGRSGNAHRRHFWNLFYRLPDDFQGSNGSNASALKRAQNHLFVVMYPSASRLALSLTSALLMPGRGHPIIHTVPVSQTLMVLEPSPSQRPLPSVMPTTQTFTLPINWISPPLPPNHRKQIDGLPGKRWSDPSKTSVPPPPPHTYTSF